MVVMPKLLAYSGIVRAGSATGYIKQVQARLGVQKTGIFGPTTEAHVRRFQRVYRLPITGVVDKQTWDMLFPTSGLHDLVLEIALAQVGILEEPLGSNRGRQIDIYNAKAGAPAGSYWCLSFVYWCVATAAERLGFACPIPREAYCPALLRWAKHNGKITETPIPGDIFLVRGEGTVIHTGFVAANPAGSVHTIEGNTNDDGSANGIGVFRRTRRTATLCFVSLDSDTNR